MSELEFVWVGIGSLLRFVSLCLISVVTVPGFCNSVGGGVSGGARGGDEVVRSHWAATCRGGTLSC